MTASFPTSSPDGKLLVDILTKTCPSAIIFARSDMLLPWRGAPVKSAAVRLPLATVPFMGALISPRLFLKRLIKIGRNEKGENKNKKERLVSYGGGTLSEFPPGPFSWIPEPPTVPGHGADSQVTWNPLPPTWVGPVPTSNPLPPAPPEEKKLSSVTTTRLPNPPGISLLDGSFLKLEPPLQGVGSPVQFTFANAGVAALILIVVVTAAIIAAVVIAITRSLVLVCLVFCIMHSYLIAVFIDI
jgi:hypothetical protein